MTEAEWFACKNVTAMLDSCQTLSDRKLRLFACAGVRPFWDVLPKNSQQAILTAERYADDQATISQLRWAKSRAWKAANSTLDTTRLSIARAAASVAASFSHWAATQVTMWLGNINGTGLPEVLRDCVTLEKKTIRDCWRTPNVISLANVAYNSGIDSLTLAAIADALEEACCDDEQLLQHLRGCGQHVKGCWALDLILGKE